MITIHSEKPNTLIADAVVYSASRRLQLIVEMKSSTETSTGWAMQLLNSLLDNSDFARAPYILLATLDRFYLWRHSPESEDLQEPVYVAPAADALAPYFEHGAKGLAGASRFGFEMAVLSWLNELVGPQGKKFADKEEYRWLTDSGLYEAIKGGSVETEVRL
ncbi:MAG: hypothetical protein JWO59_2665 [Chloroflexi bacterium]|nr:hypothetical protein [Chloroflexota bacterium]